MKINLCRLITIKYKTNSNPTRQWSFSWELERCLHYNILITANKDPGFIDPLPEKKEGGMEAMNCSYKETYSETAALAYKNEAGLEFEISPKKERWSRARSWCPTMTKRICETCSSCCTIKEKQLHGVSCCSSFFSSAAWWLLCAQGSHLEQGFEY